MLPKYLSKNRHFFFSNVNKQKLFETTVLFVDTPKSKRQRSKQQAGIPSGVSCFTPEVWSWKYRGVLLSAGQE